MCPTAVLLFIVEVFFDALSPICHRIADDLKLIEQSSFQRSSPDWVVVYYENRGLAHALFKVETWK